MFRYASRLLYWALIRLRLRRVDIGAVKALISISSLRHASVTYLFLHLRQEMALRLIKKAFIGRPLKDGNAFHGYSDGFEDKTV